MSASFTEIVVSRTAEQAFRRRALARMPNEYMEALWGKVVARAVHIHAFMPIKHTGKPNSIDYEDYDLESHEDESREVNLKFLGTVHTHPEPSSSEFSVEDLRSVQDSSDIVIAICLVKKKQKNGREQRRCEIVYWPAPRPMKVVYVP